MRGSFRLMLLEAMARASDPGGGACPSAANRPGRAAMALACSIALALVLPRPALPLGGGGGTGPCTTGAERTGTLASPSKPSIRTLFAVEAGAVVTGGRGAVGRLRGVPAGKG